MPKTGKLECRCDGKGWHYITVEEWKEANKSTLYDLEFPHRVQCPCYTRKDAD